MSEERHAVCECGKIVLQEHCCPVCLGGGGPLHIPIVPSWNYDDCCEYCGGKGFVCEDCVEEKEG